MIGREEEVMVVAQWQTSSGVRWNRKVLAVSE